MTKKKGRPRTVEEYVCVGCFKSPQSNSDCGVLKCDQSRTVLHRKLIDKTAAPPDGQCHICKQSGSDLLGCVHCGNRFFCNEHFEGVCRHCQDVHCECEDDALWNLRLSRTQPLSNVTDWSIHDHMQLNIVLEGLRRHIVTKQVLGIPDMNAQISTMSETLVAVAEEEGQNLWMVSKYKLPRPVGECVAYLKLADAQLRQERRIRLTYPISRIVYSKLDQRPIFQWPCAWELLVRSVYPRLVHWYYLPSTLDKVTPEFKTLLERETERAVHECMIHRHRLFDLTPGAYDFNVFENQLVASGEIHGNLARFWFLSRYRCKSLTGRAAVPLPGIYMKPRKPRRPNNVIIKPQP